MASYQLVRKHLSSCRCVRNKGRLSLPSELPERSSIRLEIRYLRLARIFSPQVVFQPSNKNKIIDMANLKYLTAFASLFVLASAQICDPTRVEWLPHPNSCAHFIICFHGNPLGKRLTLSLQKQNWEVLITKFYFQNFRVLQTFTSASETDSACSRLMPGAISTTFVQRKTTRVIRFSFPTATTVESNSMRLAEAFQYCELK